MLKEHRLRVVENKKPRKILGAKRDEVIGGRENCIMRISTVCARHQMSLERPDQD
jgi:hypothetical protein